MARTSKVILFSPVRQDAVTLMHVLDAHAAMRQAAERAGIKLECWYFDDNDDPESQLMIADASGDFRKVDFPNLPDRVPYTDHGWSHAAVARVTAIKDAAILKFLQTTNADALLLMDADMVPAPGMLVHLMSLQLPIVSEICWSRWKPDEPWMPNCWDIHGYLFHSPERITRLRKPGVYGVGGLGGVTLIRRAVLEMGVRFEKVAGLSDWGEDRHFCTRAAALDIPLHIDTSFPIYHVYRTSQLEEMGRWREMGSPADYFREVWLTDEWADGIRLTLKPRAPRTIACCFPGESFHRQVSCFWSDLEAHLIHRGIRPIVFYGEMSNPHGVRELLRTQVLESPVPIDLVLWIDDDQLLSVAQFDRLLADLAALPEYSIVAGWTWCDTGENPVISAGVIDGESVRCIPFAQVMQAAGVIACEWTGFPAVLMRACVLRDSGPLPFAPILAPKSRWGYTGEDIAFCLNAAARCGARVFVDPKVFVPHLKWKALGLDGKPKSIAAAVTEAAALLGGQVQVKYLDEVPVAS